MVFKMNSDTDDFQSKPSPLGGRKRFRISHPSNLRRAGSSFLHNDIVKNPFVAGAIVLCVVLLLAAVANAGDMEQADDVTPSDRPRVGLVLGGGGARGAAHIGVLRELERMRIPIDAIAGTSMGAIVGGLYASGMSVDALEMLVAVRIRNPERVYDLYPHEVSGGMGQRIMIAMMLIPDPDLLIADEPTSALDVTVQLQVLAILDDLVGRRGMGLIFISHDLNLVASFCDRVLIMYGGRIVETCAAKELDRARHPYTRGLLDCLPRLDAPRAPLPTLKRDPAWLTE